MTHMSGSLELRGGLKVYFSSDEEKRAFEYYLKSGEDFLKRNRRKITIRDIFPDGGGSRMEYANPAAKALGEALLTPSEPPTPASGFNRAPSGISLVSVVEVLFKEAHELGYEVTSDVFESEEDLVKVRTLSRKKK